MFECAGRHDDLAAFDNLLRRVLNTRSRANSQNPHLLGDKRRIFPSAELKA